MRQFNIISDNKVNYTKLGKDFINQTFNRKSDSYQNANQQQKQRIQNMINSIPKTKKELISSIYIQTQNMIVEKMRENNQKNIDKLLQLQEELHCQTPTQETQQLLEKVENKLFQFTSFQKQDDNKCQICFDKQREYVVVPCGHFIYCEQCKEQIKNKCLLCQGEVKQILKIFK